METFAQYKFAKIAPQKCRLIADKVRGMNVNQAILFLKFNNRKASLFILKTLESAMANAENNENIDIDDLKISKIAVDEGMKIKRMHARAKGRGNKILKRTSHITIVVSDI